MNLGKSLKVAMAMNDLTAKQLAEDMGCTRQHIHNMKNKKNWSAKAIEKFSLELDMSPSEFVKLGE